MTLTRDSFRSLVILVLIALPLPAARAQFTDAVREGSRIRVTTTAVKNATGTVKSVGRDTVVMFTEVNGATLALATPDIQQIKVSRGRSMALGAKRGALWGGAIGAITAFVLIASYGGDYNMGESHTGAFAVQSVLGGAMWGAGIGAFVKAERWDSARSSR